MIWGDHTAMAWLATRLVALSPPTNRSGPWPAVRMS